MKIEFNTLRNFSETKFTSTLLTNKVSMIAKCNLSTRTHHENPKSYFLPIIRIIYDKLSKIMSYKENSCKLMYNNEWCSISLKMLPLLYNNDKKVNLNRNELFIIWFLSNRNLKQYNMSLNETDDYKIIQVQGDKNVSSISSSVQDKIPQSNLIEEYNSIPNSQNLHIFDCTCHPNNYSENVTVFRLVNIMQDNTLSLVPPEIRPKKRRKKNKNNQKSHHSSEKSKIEYKQKKKKKKSKKRQRNSERDSKEQSKFDYSCEKDENIDSISDVHLFIPTTFSNCSAIFAQRRVRNFSECSNDSLEICFMDEDDENENAINNFESYKRFSTSDTDSDSGLLDEKKVSNIG